MFRRSPSSLAIASISLYATYRIVRFVFVDGTAVPAAVTLTGNFVIGSAINWVLIGLTIYTIASAVDSRLTVSVTQRVCITSIGVWYSFVWYQLYNPAGPVPPQIETLAWSLLGISLFSISLFVLISGSAFDASLITAGCFVFGYTVALLTSLTPILELLAIGVGCVVGLKNLRKSTWKQFEPNYLNLEDHIGKAVVYSLDDSRSFHQLILCLTGLITSVVPILILLFFYYNTGWTLDPPFLLSLFLFGIYSEYGMWFWTSMLERLSSRAEHGIGRSTNQTRSLGLFVPATIYAFGGISLAEQLLNPIIAAALGLVGLVSVFVIRRNSTLIKADISTMFDNRWRIYGSFLVQHSVLLILFEVAWSVPLLVLLLVFFTPDIRDISPAVSLAGLFAVSVLFFFIWNPTVSELLSIYTIPALVSLFAAFSFSLQSVKLPSEKEPKTWERSSLSTLLTSNRREFLFRSSGALSATATLGYFITQDSVSKLLLVANPSLIKTAKQFVKAKFRGDQTTVNQLVHPNASDPDLTSFETIEAEVTVTDVVVAESATNTAEVWVFLYVTDPALGSRRSYREDLELRKYKGEWKVYNIIRSGFTDSENESSKFEEKWVFEAADAVASSPTIIDDTIYIGSDDSRLYAIDTATGSKQWDFETEDAVKSSPTIHDNTVIVGSKDGYVYAVGTESGSLRWQFETGKTIDPNFQEVTSSPVVSEGVIYVAGSGIVYALDTDGTEQWRFQHKRAFFEHSPTVVGDTLYIGSGPRFWALDKEDGSVQWMFEGEELEHGSVATPATVADNLVYVGYQRGSEGGALFALDIRTGAVEWRFDTDIVTACPTVYVDTVYCCSDDLYALDRTNGNVRWKAGLEGIFPESAPTVADGSVFVGGFDKLYAFNIDDGLEIDNIELTDSDIESSATVVDGVVYIGTIEGTVHALDGSIEGSSQDSRVLLATLGHHDKVTISNGQ